MNDKSFVLALDQGTTSSRSIVFDREGTMKGIAQMEFPQIYPQPGWVEHDPKEIWYSQFETAKQAIRNAEIDPARIAAILDYILSEEGQNLLRNGIEGIHYTKNADGTITKNIEEYEKDKFGTGDYGVHWMMSLVYSDPYYVADDYQYMDFFTETSTRLEEMSKTDYFVTMFAPLDGYSSDVTKRYLSRFNELYNSFDMKFIMGELEVNDENWQLWLDTIESEAHYSELVAEWTQAYKDYLAANGG